MDVFQKYQAGIPLSDEEEKIYSEIMKENRFKESDSNPKYTVFYPSYKYGSGAEAADKLYSQYGEDGLLVVKFLSDFNLSEVRENKIGGYKLLMSASY